jgi:hypothetical protein
MTSRRKTSNKQKLASLVAYLPNDKEISTLVKICNLQPVDNWRVWNSAYGSELKAQASKAISLKLYDNLQRPDLFQNRDLKEIVQLSKVVSWKFERLAIWCHDDILRVYVRQDRWVRVCPLSFGIDHIRQLIQFENVEPVEDFFQGTEDGFISWWPLSDSLQNKIRENLWKSKTLTTLMPAV